MGVVTRTVLNRGRSEQVRVCRVCGSADLRSRVQRYKDGQQHERFTCNECGEFAGWGKLLNPDEMRQRRKSGQRRRYSDAARSLRCPRCHSLDILRSPFLFRDGTTHMRNECANCGKFLKWGDPPARAGASRQRVEV